MMDTRRPKNGFVQDREDGLPQQIEMVDTFEITQCIFSEKTWREFLTGGQILHHKDRTTLPPGTRVLCQLPSGIVGILELTTFSDTNCVWRESLLIDPEMYSGDDVRYNKYEFGTRVHKIFEPPIPYEEVATLCGIDSKQRNNIVKRGQMSYRKLF